MTGFGPNEWLVDEIYQQYLADKDSVDPAWWDFFADYQPADATLPKPPVSTGNGHPNGAVEAPPTQATQTAVAAPAQPEPPTPAATRAAQSAGADEFESVPLRGAAARVVDNMQTSLTVPDRDVGPRGPGQAPHRQPHRDQQPPGQGPRRQGVVHPPHRLGRRPGGRAACPR